MNSTVSTIKLSRQAGHILPHLTWLPKEVLEIIKRFPYHSARLFAAGMDYVLNKQRYYTVLDGNDPIHFISSSSYGYTLNIREFVGFIPTGTVGLFLNIGSIAEQALIDNQDLKKVLWPTNPSVQLAINQYNSLNNVFPDLRTKKEVYSYFDEPSIGKRIDILVQAIDAGASNLAGLKECYLAACYYARAYNRVNLLDSGLLGNIDALDYELPPFPDTIEIKDGDKFIFDKPEVRYEKHWPDVLLRDGKYSIVHHPREPEFHTIATPNTSNYDDIRMAESNVGEMACFILCKRNGKWGAVYSNGLHYFFILIVPYIYDSPDEVAREVNEIIDMDNDTKWVTWDDFKGVFHYPDA
jgi:hypothetical protein